MWRVPSDLLPIAQRIADAENRLEKLATRIERLKEEGSDATDAEETLTSIRATLHQLYVRQSGLRQNCLVISR
jgi:hypothetical protein